MFYIGLDVHMRSSALCILDERGNVIEERTIRGDRRKAIDHLRRLKEPFTVCYEASCGYGWLYDQLATIARRVVVAHPGKLRLIFQSTRKSDRVDAKKLAIILMLGEVPTVHVPHIDIRAWRETIEMRRRQVQQRTRLKNQIRAMLRTYGVSVPREVGGLWTGKGLQWLGAVTWPTANVAWRCRMLILQLRQIEEVVAEVTRQLDAMGTHHPGVALLQTIPGVGPRTAEAFAAYVDDPYRFAKNKCIGAYFGLVPRQDQSGQINRLGRVTKEGPATVRQLVCEAAWRCVKLCPSMKAMFERVQGEKRERRKIALIAVAHRLLRIMLAMLKTGETWRDESLPAAA